MISVWSCLREGVDVIVRRLPLFLGAWILVFVVQQAIRVAFPYSGPWAWLNLVLLPVLLAPLYAGQYFIALQVARGKPVNYRDLFRGFSQWRTIALVFILTALAVTGGGLLLVIPGIIFALMFTWAPILVLDPEEVGANRRIRAVEAMRESKELTTGYRGVLFGIGILLLLPSVVLTYMVSLSPAIPPWAIQLLRLLSGTLFLGPLHAASYMVAYEAVRRLGRSGEEATILPEPGD
jgi:uncharacterized membrane protein